MTYRVINLSTGEIVSELDDFEEAKELADQLAANGMNLEQWAVVELVTVYETPMHQS